MTSVSVRRLRIPVAIYICHAKICSHKFGILAPHAKLQHAENLKSGDVLLDLTKFCYRAEALYADVYPKLHKSNVGEN